MSERMTGSDAVLLHMEDANTPMHTLKIIILDPSRRGRPVTLEELALAVGSRLGLVARSTQKVVAAFGFGARPFWVDDPDFDLRRHVDEQTLAAPGGTRELDDLYGQLATTGPMGPHPRARAGRRAPSGGSANPPRHGRWPGRVAHAAGGVHGGPG